MTTDRYAALAGMPFEGGYPADDSARALDEELFFQRACQVYLWALPAMNMYAIKEGLEKVAGTGYNVMSVFEKRLKPNTVITTPNSDVIYGLTFADLSATGPLVLEVPPRLQALMDDFWHRPLTGPVIDGRRYLGDVGIPGPDRGKGGRYLIVPDGYDGDTEGCFTFTCPTNGVFIFVRGFFPSVDDLAPGVASVESLTIRPLEGGAEPMRFEHVSDLPANALFSADGSYFDMLDRFVQSEPDDAVDPYMHGMLAALGIARGRTFAPSVRHRELARPHHRAHRRGRQGPHVHQPLLHQHRHDVVDHRNGRQIRQRLQGRRRCLPQGREHLPPGHAAGPARQPVLVGDAV